jgi:hypothetical protein
VRPLKSNVIREKRMKKKIPKKVYAQVAVGFFFSSLILLYFSYRLLLPTLLSMFNLEIAVYIIFFICFGLCSLMVKPTIKKEMEKIEEPFSIVARNPNIEIPKEKLTFILLVKRSILSLVVTLILSLPLTLIVFFRFIASTDHEIKIFFTLFSSYSIFYSFFLGISFFAVFIFVPSLKEWHWTKHQFG